MSEKNRAPTTARQESCEQEFDNEAIVGEVTAINNDITDDFIDVDHGVRVSGDVTHGTTPANNDDTPSNSSITPTNFDVTLASNDAPPSNNDVTPSNNIATSTNNDITDDNDTNNDIMSKEQKYLTRITELENSLEVLNSGKIELEHQLTMLNNKCQFYESHLPSHDALCQERDQYKLDELQKKFDTQASVSPQQNDTIAPLNADTFQLVHYKDIEV